MKKIFAIDPGNVYSAYCIMTDDFQLQGFAKLENKQVMDKMLEALDEVDQVVIERIASYGMAVGREVFDTCEWIGRFTQEAEKKVPVSYIYRKDEKMYICGSMKANDSNIRQSLIDRFAKFDLKNGKGTKANPDYFYGVSKDIWASIAVAVSYYDKTAEEKREGKPKEEKEE